MLLPSALDIHKLGFLQVDLVRYSSAVEIPVKHPVVSLVGFIPEEEARCAVQDNSDINRHGLYAVELILLLPTGVNNYSTNFSVNFAL